MFDFNKTCLNVPLTGGIVDCWLQLGPVYVGGQVHVYVFPTGLHWPPDEHGFGEQGEIGWFKAFKKIH